QPAHAIELLELARRRARDANSVPALREVVRVANAIAAGNRGGRRQAALQIGHAAEESIRRLEPPERDLVSQASLDGLEHARAQALAEGSVEKLREVLELARRAAAESSGSEHAAALKLVYAVGQSISHLTTQ